MLDKLVTEIREKIEKVDVREVHGIAMGTLLKGYDFQKSGQVSFNDGGMPSSQVDRMGFYHKGEDVTVILETTQDYHPVVENNITHYEPEYIVIVRFYSDEVDDLEFCGDLEEIDMIVRRQF